MNHPHFTVCSKPGNYCIADLQHKKAPGSVGENLRNEPAIVVPFNFREIVVAGRPLNYKSEFNTLQRTVQRINAIYVIANGVLAMVSTINNITNMPSPMPGLIQDDSSFPRCNMNNLPDHCNATSVCHCSHLVQLDVCKVYEFLLIDNRESKLGSMHKYRIQTSISILEFPSDMHDNFRTLFIFFSSG